MPTLLRHHDGWKYHGAAIAYATLAYGLGLAGLLSGSWTVNFAATLLLAHGMTIAAYLVHEAGHNTVFRSIRHNAWLGRAMSWLCGAPYNRFEDIRFKHFRHHVENDDIVAFDYEKFFLDHPLIFRLTRALEWCYVPAHELVMHGVMMVTAFVFPQRRSQRRRNAVVIVIRAGLYLLLALISLKAALLYALAYLMMIVVLRFMDSLQHDYEYNLTLFSRVRSAHAGDRDWEQAHTFSVPLSLKHPWLNWLTLNFGYHNAHHAHPEEPWYRLPAVHRELYGDDPDAVIPFSTQLKIYHRGRTRRIVKWDRDASDAPVPEGRAFLQAARAGDVYGGNAASFLTAH